LSRCIDSAATPVVVVHGLWMGAWQMSTLKAALVRGGHRSYRYHYASALSSYSRNQDGLARLVNERVGAPCDFVAHSLGGLLVLDLLQQKPELCAGRVVCLGTPINGSAVIARLQSTPLRTVVGYAGAALLRGAQAPASHIKVSMLAGTRSLGGGKLLARLDGPNDGSVCLSETQAPWLAHHDQLPLTHTQLVFSPRAQRRVMELLA